MATKKLLDSIFTKKNLPKKSLSSQKYDSFDVFKISQGGKKQQRKLCFAEDGVRNYTGETLQWYLGPESVLSLKKHESNPNTFTLTGVLRFNFEAQNEEQLNTILESFSSYNLDKVGIEKLMKDKDV